MANINTTKKKNVVELIRDTQNARLENIVVNGTLIGAMGFSDDAGRKAALNTIQEAVDNSENIFDMMLKINQMATIEESNVEPDEQIEVDDEMYLVNYTQKKAYTMDCEEIANMDDLRVPNMPKEAIKAILVDRIKLNQQ